MHIVHPRNITAFVVITILSLFFSTLTALAQTHTGTLPLRRTMRLQIEAPCLKEIVINPAETQSTNDPFSWEGPSPLTLHQNDPNTLVLEQPYCTRHNSESDSSQEGRLTLSLPPTIPLAINAPYATTIHSSSPRNFLSLLTGGDTYLGEVQELNLAAQKGAHVTIDKLTGQSTLYSKDSTTVTINAVKTPALSIRAADQSTVTIHDGTLNALAIQSSTSQDTHYTVDARFAWVHLLGTGNIFIQKISGALATQRDGAGKLEVQNPPLPASFKRKS